MLGEGMPLPIFPDSPASSIFMPSSTPPVPERNLLIEASAGSGKTHHLVGRFLRLLLVCREPDRIIALTFTRKAAGEFFDRILGALAEAAVSEEAAARTARSFRVAGLDREEALSLLRLATDSLHRLSLGTLDSFFSRVLRCFPGEFGIQGDFEVMDDTAETEARRNVLDRILEDVGDAGPFLAAFRQATFGAEEKRLLSNLETFVSRYHRLVISCPDRDRWTKARAIWPQAPWWLSRTYEIDAIASIIREHLPAISEQHKSAAKGFEKFAEELPRFSEGATGRNLKGLLEKLLPHLEDLEAGEVSEFFYHKKLEFSAPLQQALADAIGFILQREIVSKLQQTGGIFDIVRRYESTYHQEVRRTGRLSFDDILILLAGAAPDDRTIDRSPALSMLDPLPDAAGRRLQVDYRLDATFHHWLIDEFQDTSRRQWKVLENLVEEVIEDDSGDRTFYYVGDEKQAIYGWRGGDSRLFQEIRKRYNQPPRPEDRWIGEEHLDVSWRSGPVLLEAVNTIFGNFEGLSRLLGPDHASVISDRWANTNAGNHAPSPLTENRPGHFRFVTLDEEAADEEGPTGIAPLWRAVMETLRELDPVGNQLSVAILMRRGNPASELADAIRQDGQIPVMVEGQMPVGTDHPIATSFAALLRFAAHPGDTAAWQHIAMTPALRNLDAESLQKARYEIPREVLAQIQDRGFAFTFTRWVDRIGAETEDPLDPFSSHRVNQVAEACRQFDLRGSRSIEAFLRYLANYSAADLPSAGVVQIMTIHKAKGLTFDAVIVADLKPGAITQLRDLEAVKGYDDRRELQWILTAPRKELAKAVEPLRSAYLEAEMDTALEELCALYVALTRARYANHVILPKLPSKKESTAPNRLLAHQFEEAGFETRSESLGGVPVRLHYEEGDQDWISTVRSTSPESEPPDEPPTAPSALPFPGRRRFPRRQRRIPSNAADRTHWGGAAGLFVPESASATELGSAVHALFEEIEWWKEDSLESCSQILASFPEHAEEARRQVEASFADPEIRRRFEAGSYSSPVVWRERRFEMVTPDSEWISGVFDRVVLEQNPDGSFARAHLVDFKTNRVESEEEIAAAVDHYRSQMSVYRAALTRLTGLPDTAIDAELIFTRPVQIRRVF